LPSHHFWKLLSVSTSESEYPNACFRVVRGRHNSPWERLNYHLIPMFKFRLGEKKNGARGKPEPLLLAAGPVLRASSLPAMLAHPQEFSQRPLP
jgi:hypothetical protein